MEEKPEPVRHPRGGRRTEVVVEKRVSAVYKMYVEGMQRPEMAAEIARQQKEEASEREAARSKQKKIPPATWGDEPVPARTLRFYVQKAKARIKAEGVKLLEPGQGDFILAKNFARMDDVYQRALKVGRFEVCRKIVVDQLQLCSLFGKIAVSLSALDQRPPERDEENEEETKAPEYAERTIEQNAAATAEFLNGVRKRLGQKPLDIGPLALMPTGTNGSNGK